MELGPERTGPCLVILGGIHGDEPQGMRAALRIGRRLTDTVLDGRVRIVPVCHEAAAEVGSRTSPLDGDNLARVFPGHPAGSPTERLAALIDSEVIAGADVLLDLHSAGLHYAMPLLAGYCDDGSKASQGAAGLAGAAGLPVVWRHPGPPAAGRTGTGPHRRGVPFIYLESTDGRHDNEAYVDAVVRMAGAAGFIRPASGTSPASSGVRHLLGSGALDAGGIVTPWAGIVEPRVDCLDEVRAGEIIATVDHPDRSDRHEIVAPTHGVVVMVRRPGWVARDALVVFLTQEDALAS